MITGRSARWRRPFAWFRPLTIAVVPVALASAAFVPAAANHPALPGPAGPAHRAGSPATSGLRPLRLPGVPGSRAGSSLVTLITGDRVILHALGAGQYVVTSVPLPGSGSAIDVTSQGGPAGVTSLEAVPEDARPLIRSGRVDPGLFDVRYLLTHGDTAATARIPVVIQYGDHLGTAALARRAASLPGATVLATRLASDQAEVSVAVGRAAAFWTALTGRSGAAPPWGGPAGLAGGATRLWLAGHLRPLSSAPPPRPGAATLAGTPRYPVSEVITRTTGPLQYSLCEGAAVHLSCPQPFLLGLAGAALGQTFSYPRETCLRRKPGRPFPVCLAMKFSFQVPAGVYFAGGNGGMLTTDDSDHTIEAATVELDVPQFTVTGPTTVDLNADRAVPVTVTAPQPASSYGVPDTLESTRVLPDGRWYSSLTQAAYGDNNWWAVPTGATSAGQRATLGSYTFTPGVTLGRPPVTAMVTAPVPMALHPLYPMYSRAYDNASARPSRFTGRQALRLVDAGEGTAGDFRAIDARGKLALIRTLATCAPNPFAPGPCTTGSVLPEQLANAGHAGAAGVLIDPGPSDYALTLPVYLATGRGWPPVPRQIPFAEIDHAEAEALRGLLGRGVVSVTIDDSGQSPYVYFLSFDEEGQIPGSLHYAVTSQQLAGIDASYHFASHVPMGEGTAAFRPDIFFTGGGNDVFAGPATIREYYGPLSPDTVWWQMPDIPLTNSALPTIAFFGQPGLRTLSWNEPPTAPGALNLQPGVNQAQPGKYWQYCAGCRQGNTLYPIFWASSGANPGAEVSAGGYAPGHIHLYDQAGQEIPPILLQGVVVYSLPPRTGRYRLVTQSGRTSTTWEFTSAAPATDQTPPGTACIGTISGLSTAPCAAAPLLFLRYNAFTSLSDSVAAPGAHRLEVTAYHQAPGAPPVTGLRLWISTDGGTSWQRLHVAARAGVFEARYSVPPLTGTNGYVSIRAQTADAAGNDISQTILDAFALSS